MADRQATATGAPVDWNGEQFDRVREIFESSSSAGSADTPLLERVRADIPGPGAPAQMGVGVLRDLLRIERRPERFRRLLRVWSGKVATAIRRGEFSVAAAWMKALTDRQEFPPDFASHVSDAVRELSRPELVDELVTVLAHTTDTRAAAPLLAGWGEPLVERLVELLVVDDPPVNRRHVVDYLGMAGRDDVRPLAAHLRDSRWFVVRNVATALGRSGRDSAIPALEAVADHEDERVRLEVLRALAALSEGDVSYPLAALKDSSLKVRQAAVSLLRASPSDEVVTGLTDILTEGVASPDEARRLVDVIAERRSEAAVEALESLAEGRRGGKKTRVVRDAARAGLERLG